MDIFCFRWFFFCLKVENSFQSVTSNVSLIFFFVKKKKKTPSFVLLPFRCQRSFQMWRSTVASLAYPEVSELPAALVNLVKSELQEGAAPLSCPVIKPFTSNLGLPITQRQGGRRGGAPGVSGSAEVTGGGCWGTESIREIMTRSSCQVRWVMSRSMRSWSNLASFNSNISFQLSLVVIKKKKSNSRSKKKNAKNKNKNKKISDTRFPNWQPKATLCECANFGSLEYRQFGSFGRSTHIYLVLFPTCWCGGQRRTFSSYCWRSQSR